MRPEALVEAIARYLERHPEAADSIIGIRQWWLDAQFKDVSDEDIHVAIDVLVAAGKVNCFRIGDGTALYSLASPAGTPEQI